MTVKEYTQELEAIRREVVDAKKLRDRDEQIFAVDRIGSLALMLTNDLIEGLSPGDHL